MNTEKAALIDLAKILHSHQRSGNDKIDVQSVLYIVREGTEKDYWQAAGHYQRCDYWKFTHAVRRGIDWKEHSLSVYYASTGLKGGNE